MFRSGTMQGVEPGARIWVLQCWLLLRHASHLKRCLMKRSLLVLSSSQTLCPIWSLFLNPQVLYSPLWCIVKHSSHVCWWLLWLWDQLLDKVDSRHKDVWPVSRVEETEKQNITVPAAAPNTRTQKGGFRGKLKHRAAAGEQRQCWWLLVAWLASNYRLLI